MGEIIKDRDVDAVSGATKPICKSVYQHKIRITSEIMEMGCNKRYISILEEAQKAFFKKYLPNHSPRTDVSHLKFGKDFKTGDEIIVNIWIEEVNILGFILMASFINSATNLEHAVVTEELNFVNQQEELIKIPVNLRGSLKRMASGEDVEVEPKVTKVGNLIIPDKFRDRVFVDAPVVEAEIEELISIDQKFDQTKKDVEVIVDRDASLNYETRRWVYLSHLPVMWVLTVWVMFKKKILSIKPKINTFWMDGLSIPSRKVKEGAASWRALDIIYNFQFGQQNGIKGKVSDYWFKIINAQAVRNRFRLVKRELIKAIREIAQKEKEVRLFSIASGSAQAVIEAMSEVRKQGIKVQAVLLDLDRTAIKYSQKMAEQYGFRDEVKCIRSSTTNLQKAVDGKRPHIIEMIGFLDYRPHDRAVHLITKIHKLLLPGGKFLTANMCPNVEQSFMKWILNWSIIYREPKELRSILVESDFNAKTIRLIYEPLKLHVIAICNKLA